MSDVRQTIRNPSTSAGNYPAPGGGGSFAPRDGFRVDPPHQLAGADTVAPPIDSTPLEYDVIQEPLVAPYSAGAVRTDDLIGNPVLQAQQIAEHLQQRYADLHRREQRLHVQLADLDQERRTIRMWVADCEADLQQRDVDLLQRNADCNDRESSCLALEHEMQSRKAELLRQESELQHIQDRWRDEWELERQTLQQELDQQRLQLQNDQAHFALVKEGQLADIQQERSLLLNRIRFQEDHLQKLRREFEAIQAAFHLERQRAQSTIVETDAQIQRRQAHLDRQRAVLEERDAAVQRQYNLLNKMRRAELESLALDRQRFEAEQHDWQLIHETQHAELERKNEILQSHAENLEARQSRLEQLRLELEATNGKTMEMRLAVEEACAQLAQAVGPEVARQRIEAAQLALSQHHRQARETLIRHRQELEQFQRSVLLQRDEFRTEQQTLTEWISQRDEELQFRAENFQAEQAAAIAREQSWQQARERWLQEKLEAEAVIRDLLRRVEQQPG